MAAMRLYNFYQSFKKAGATVSVLTTSNRSFFPSDSFYPPFENIKEIKTLDFRALYNKLFGGTALMLLHQDKRRPVIRILKSLVGVLFIPFIIGEGGMFYILKGYLSGRDKIKSGNVRMIFSSSKPLSDHIIAFLLRRKFKHVRWIADFRDIVGIENGLKKHGLESFMVRKADLALTVSDGLSKYFEKFTGRIVVLRNGVNERYPHVEYVKNQKFTFTYTGTIYPQLQSLKNFTKALQMLVSRGIIPLDMVSFCYAGNDFEFIKGEFADHGLEEILVDNGAISIADSWELQTSSDVNVLLTWSNTSKGILTGKLFEYLASGRPVLALVNGRCCDEELEQLLAYEDCLVSYSDQWELVADFMHSRYASWLNNKEEMIKRDKCTYSWNDQFDRLLATSAVFRHL